MKYYADLANLEIFTLDEARKVIGNKNTTIATINSYTKKGYLKRIKNNLYATIDLTTLDTFVNKYVIASHINETSFISFHSAFEFYGRYNQVFNIVQVSSTKRFYPFIFDNIEYNYYQTKSLLQVETIQGVKVTSLERTIVDSINMLGKVMDLEELVKCISLITYVDENKLIEVLEYYDKDILYRKVGYVLSFFKEQLLLKDSFFDYCHKKSNNTNQGKISSGEINKLTYIHEWGLYAYEDLLKLVDKGGNVDV